MKLFLLTWDREEKGFVRDRKSFVWSRLEGRKKDLADFSLSFTISKENNPLEGIKVNVRGRALEDLHGIDVVAN